MTTGFLRYLAMLTPSASRDGTVIRTGRAARCTGYPRGSFPSASAVTSTHTRASFSLSGSSVMLGNFDGERLTRAACGAHTGGYPPRDRLDQFALAAGVHERVRARRTRLLASGSSITRNRLGCAPSPTREPVTKRLAEFAPKLEHQREPAPPATAGSRGSPG